MRGLVKTREDELSELKDFKIYDESEFEKTDVLGALVRAKHSEGRFALGESDVMGNMFIFVSC